MGSAISTFDRAAGDGWTSMVLSSAAFAGLREGDGRRVSEADYYTQSIGDNYIPTRLST
jgi:hypothetical protein